MLFRPKDCTPSGIIITVTVVIVLGMALVAFLKG